MIKKTLEQARNEKWHEDIIDGFIDAKKCGYRCSVELVETTIGKLAERCAGTACGVVGNRCYEKIAQKFPDIKVRCYFNANEGNTGSVEMLCSEEQGKEIQALASAGDGSLRFEDCTKNEWFFFETE